MINKNKKRGDGIPFYLVTFILLIVSFAIIAYVFYSFDWEGTIDRESCHRSVVLRMTLPDAVEAKDFVPLQCKTRQVCVTKKIFGDECEDELEGDYEVVRVSGNKKKMEVQINKIVAQEMADCWIMMGEGKGQIFTREFEAFKTAKTACSVCSRISFDKSIKDEFDNVGGLGEYMIKYKVPTREISYWALLTGFGRGSYEEVNDKFSTKQKAIVFVELDKTNAPEWIVGTLGVGVGGYSGAKLGALIGSFVPIPGVGTVTGGLVGFVGGVAIGGLLGISDGNTIADAIGEDVQAGTTRVNLKNIDYASGMFLVDYDDSIQKLKCDNMENIPFSPGGGSFGGSGASG